MNVCMQAPCTTACVHVFLRDWLSVGSQLLLCMFIMVWYGLETHNTD